MPVSKLRSCRIKELGNNLVKIDFKSINDADGDNNYSIIRHYAYEFSGKSIIIKDNMVEVEKDKYKIDYEVMLATKEEDVYLRCGVFNTDWTNTDSHLFSCACDLVWEKIYQLIELKNN